MRLGSSTAVGQCTTSRADNREHCRFPHGCRALHVEQQPIVRRCGAQMTRKPQCTAVTTSYNTLMRKSQCVHKSVCSHRRRWSMHLFRVTYYPLIFVMSNKRPRQFSQIFVCQRPVVSQVKLHSKPLNYSHYSAGNHS